MAPHEFPAFRLMTQLARQISSPVATRIKNFAKENPLFSQLVCAPTAEAWRRLEWRARIMALRATQGPKAWREPWTRAPPPPLSPRDAREMGGDLLGEIVIFILGAIIVTYEVNRQAIIAEEKKIEKRATWAQLLHLLDESRQQLEQQQRLIDDLRARLQAHTSRADPDPPPLGQGSDEEHSQSNWKCF